MANNIWVEKDRYHTAIVLPTQLVRDIAVELIPVLNEQALVRFGWGERSYYGAAKKNLFMVIKALLLPTGSVMEVSTFDTLSEVGDSIVPINLTDINIDKLLRFIIHSFRWDNSGQPILERTEANGCRYYRARGIYHMFKNCNNWTALALKRSGLQVRYLLAFFGNSVMKQLR